MYNYSNKVFNEISDEVLRLHVIANSDEEKDQEVKLKVRDKVLEYINLNCDKIKNKQDALSFVTNNSDNIKKIAEDVLQENGFYYDVEIEIGKFDFPTKHYSNISLPLGEYDAVRITLGEAQGQNWWCVMFPPLCFIDNNAILEDEEILKENLSQEGYELISEDNNEIKIKFFTVEMIEKIKQKLNQL